MPSLSDSVEKVQDAFASKYNIDIDQIRAESANTKAMAAAPSVPSAAGIYGAPSVGAVAGPLLSDLENITYASIPADETIPNRLVEYNLDEAGRLLQVCASLRSDYSELARLFVETQLRAEEFFRLDAVHIEEASNSLYAMPYEETKAERESLERALKTLNDENDNIVALTTNGDLDQSHIETYTDTIADTAKYAATVKVQETRDNQKFIALYRSRLEKASWAFSQQSALSNIRLLEGRLEAAKVRESYYRKDIGFRARRAAISRDVAYRQLSEHNRPGSILNYSERLSAIGPLYAASFKRLCARVAVVKSGAFGAYGIDLPPISPNRTAGLLDEIAGWILGAQQFLSSRYRREMIAVHTVWLKSKLSVGQNLTQALRSAQGFSFKVTPIDTGGQNGLLRGVGIEYTGSGKRPISFIVIPPSGSTSNLSAISQIQIQLQFGRVLPVGTGEAPQLQFTDRMWNGDPYEFWTLKELDDLVDNVVEDVALHLWISHK